MHLMLGAAVLGAADKIKHKMRIIAAQALGVEPSLLDLQDGVFVAKLLPRLRLSFDDVARIAHRRAELRPANMEPGLVETYVYRTPKSGEREDNWAGGHFRTRGYTSFAFAAHVPIVEIDAETYAITLTHYYIVHDCGVQMNPQIVAGLVYGGTMRGIDAALLSEYVYSDNGQLLTQSFMDHLLSSALEVPHMTMDDICTPAPGHPLVHHPIKEGWKFLRLIRCRQFSIPYLRYAVLRRQGSWRRRLHDCPGGDCERHRGCPVRCRAPPHRHSTHCQHALRLAAGRAKGLICRAELPNSSVPSR
jgi:hypothetical protein